MLNHPRTLFLLAGMPGSGKSTILRKAYSNNLQIFGEKHHEAFLQTNLQRSAGKLGELEYIRLKRHSFHAIDIPRLRPGKNMPSCILVHMDLRNILARLSITHSENITDIFKSIHNLVVPREDISLLHGETNDLLLRNYLSDPFFHKFDRVILNTLYCDFQQNCLQYLNSSRWEGGTKPEMMFNADLQTSQKIYSEIYQCWSRNLDVLPLSHCFKSRLVANDVIKLVELF